MTLTETNNRRLPAETPAFDHELNELFLDELADMLDAEQQFTKALPKMIETVEADDLRGALETHLEEARGHIGRVERVFECLEEETRTRPCKGMKGILEDGDAMVTLMQGTWSLDAAVIAACRKVEYYQIASYDTLIGWAEQLGHDQAVQLLRENLREEEAADQKLTEIARSIVERQAEPG